MKTSITILLLCLLLTPFWSLSQRAKELFEGKVSTDVLINDVDKIQSDLEEHHPNVYKFIDKQSLNLKFDSLKKTIVLPITRMEFRYKVLTVLQKVGDGHMTLIMNGSHVSLEDYQTYIGNTIRPMDQFQFKVIDMRLFILSSLYNPGIKAGTEIVTVNGLPAWDVIAKIFGSICVDGYNNTFKYYSLNSGKFSNFYTNTFGNQNSVKFELSGFGEKKAVEINNMSPTASPTAFPSIRLPPYPFSKDK
ncbi:MAG TPA: hypothetical protein VF679_08050, partial [Pedobacter sp.]